MDLAQPGYWPLFSWPFYGLLGYHWPTYRGATASCRIMTPLAQDRVYTLAADDRIFTPLADDRIFTPECGG